MVLVHGSPAGSYLWHGVVPLLARTHTVHVWDLLGFGDSHPGPDTTPSIAQQARTLAELVEHWNLTDPSLVVWTRSPPPTLVLWGEQDQWLPPATGDRLAAAIPAARRETIPAAGHFLPEDRPEETADALQRFLT